ncbi:carbohydrate porin [Burkholderia pseudomallei]|uniref:carbohydrate porin n=1 Tax=Burkholderia pseudomallei TaxID=28450 RepID=UPI000A1A1A2E|nr:carbohydrate porin [Burkholderia pseudomallei]ARL93225.1 carbohydrate porin [Burkholderia pseudomallei]ARM03530.1 carbohydrate porin [Burkholderia pseudomallei]MBH9657508.1 carbohydrate porin [Burkholderia pseudomallei]MEB5484744.1 carbohydrate porin [Burkholderia pseudomallei]MEB5491075.1 carbohydrate porin [Burkholderia pseudomallei]
MQFSPLLGRPVRHLQRRAVRHAAFACAWLFSSAAFAEASPGAPPAAPEADLSIRAQPVTQWTGVWTRQNLLGDIGGLRPWLGKYGVTLGLAETSEYLANLRGGLKRGGTYDGLTTATLTVDTQKAFGLPGGTFNASALQIHGRNLSQYNLGTLNTASGIEAQDTTRLWELWYQQSFLDQRVDVKIGQQSLDQEFMVSQYAATFINTMFGWPALPSYDLPNGGPAYPLAALGVRVRGKITPSLTALAGVFDGDPLGNHPNDLSGTSFNLHNGTLFIGELQYALNQPADGQMDTGPSNALPGTYKIGVWYHNGRFADQQIDSAGLSLADPASSGVARAHHGDYSFYAVADQMVWRPDPTGAKSLGVFARVMAAPGDRNLVSVAANAGVVLKAPFEGRDNDSVGLAVTYIEVGSHARALDANFASFTGGPYGVRTSETALEATYQYQVTPWWQLQADAQYTFHTGAGQNPSDPAQPLRNTFVVGLRTNISF